MTSNLNRLLAGAAALLALASPAAQAQQGAVVSGRVLTEANAPLQGASVGIPALRVGAYTNADGAYRFTVPATNAGQTVTITARHIGYQPKSLSVTLASGTVTQDFTLVAQPTQLTGVVVTALGITKEKSQLGTAQQQLSTQELNTTFDPNIINQLSGKVSGVNIVGSGTQGGSTNITIRGYTSISGTNQPLFIVDGVPVSNYNRGSGSGGGGLSGSKDYGNAIADINPEDIATLTVLKGPNAAALYGSRAANGAIVITTKRGVAGNTSIQWTSSVTFDRPSRIPDFQNQYGQGSAGQFTFVNGLGALDGNDQSYGPKLDGRLIHQFTDGSDTTKKSPWIAHPDNVESFFTTGKTMNSTVALSGGTERANARLSLTGENVDGIIPNNFLRKLGANASGSLQLNDRLSATGSVQYLRNTGLNRPGVGYVGGIVEGLYVWFGRQVDMNALKQNWQQSATVNNGPSTREYNWNYSYHNNPYFMQYANPESDTRDRAILNGTATYKVLPWINATLRSGTDFFRYNVNNAYAQGNIELNNPTAIVDQKYAGAFSLIRDTYNENNTELLFTANHSAGSHLTLNATAGGNRRLATYTSEGVSTTGIIVPNIYNVANAGISPTNSQYAENRQINSAYGSASFTFNGWWTVEGTARNDWSSTLPKANNSYFYPSVNTSIVLTDAVPMLRTDAINYIKLRGSFARVGADAAPYQLATTYAGSSAKFGSLPLFSLGNALLNRDLKPEQTTSSEGGLEIGLLDNRVSIDASIYDKYTTDQIVNLAVSTASGFSSKVVNAGKIDNKGFEAVVNATPIRSARWDWNSTFSYTRNRGKVVELYPGLLTIVMGGFRNTTIEARAGEPFGTIRGYSILKDSATGLPILSGGTYNRGPLENFGAIQPDWQGGWTNSLRFRGVTFTGTLDIRRGGKLFSGTNFYGQATGVLANTLLGREQDWDKPGVVANGLDAASCATGSHTVASTATAHPGQYVCINGTKNTEHANSEDYFQSISYNEIGEPYVYDASYTKLRELRVSFDLPSRLVSRLYASSANVAFIGRNLYTWTNVPNIDPEFSYSAGNGQGTEFGALPNPRSIGFSIRITP